MTTDRIQAAIDDIRAVAAQREAEQKREARTWRDDFAELATRLAGKTRQLRDMAEENDLPVSVTRLLAKASAYEHAAQEITAILELHQPPGA